MRKFVVPALAAICIAGAFAAPAAAAETDTVVVKVGYSDLDLKTETGRDALEARIATAVKAACAKPETRSIKLMQAWESCKDSASSSAAQQFEKTVAFSGI
ncbi:MAG: UrcA family protein [Novosphingobium sp.]|nr:UrcA family protein [Novosphingobium sp.]